MYCKINESIIILNLYSFLGDEWKGLAGLLIYRHYWQIQNWSDIKLENLFAYR